MSRKKMRNLAIKVRDELEDSGVIAPWRAASITSAIIALIDAKIEEAMKSPNTRKSTKTEPSGGLIDTFN